MDTKLKAIRAGHKGEVTKLLRKFEDIRQNTESTETDADEISTLLEAFKQKKVILLELNEKILEQTQEEEIAEEIQDSDEYMYTLDYKLRQIRNLADSSKTASISLSVDSPANESTLNPNANIFIHQNVQPTSSYFSNQPTHVPNLQSSSTYSSRSDYHKLPKLNLPTFEGNILDWQSFWDSYETAIHTNLTLSDVQKFNYLKSLLFNEALQTITGFSMTNANYAKAISLLQERYGQVHKIIQTYMQALLDIPAPIYSLISLRNYYDKTETYVRGLESLGQTDETYGSLLVPVILNKLPPEIRQHLAREHKSTNWTLNELRKALLSELNIMEAVKLPEIVKSPHATAAFLTNTKTRPKSSFSRNDKSVSFSNRNTKSCLFCHETGHFAVNCTKVTTPEDRMTVVKKDRLCFNCLGHHRLADCKSSSNCKKCNKRHHTSLCTDKTNHKSEESSKPNTDGKGNTVLHSSLTHKDSNVMLKTAIANVSSGKYTTAANILFDEGAQRSFITESLADKLQLCSTGNEVVHLNGFGEENTQIRHLRSATVKLETDEGERIPLNVLIIPEIAVPIQTHIKSVSELKHIRGLKLAHPVSSDDMFEISLLIGADYYWNIVGDRIIRGNGPTAVESKIGYLLSGPTTSKTGTFDTSSMLNIMISHKVDECNLEKFWEIESLGVEGKKTNTEHEDFLESYENSISYHDNRYYAKLPWKHEYLTSLREYHRNRRKNEQTIKTGDVVQVYDDSPRTKWTLAVVDKLNIGGDGIARSAVIRTKNGLTSRPITKLYPLEVSLNRDSEDNHCDMNCSKNSVHKAKTVAMDNIKKWTNAK